MTWLGLSVVASIVLTVLLNVGLRLFPDAGRRIAREVTQLTSPRDDPERSNDRVRVWAPWKAMLIASVLLTLLLNLVLMIGRL
jgi:hypothetical protein